MNLAEALLPLLPGPGTAGALVAFVGAGGKTSSLFRLARDLAAQGRTVLVTTTTHLFDPRLDPATAGETVLFQPELEHPYAGGTLPPALPRPEPGLTILLSRGDATPGKVMGVHPSWLPILGRSWAFVLAEADGAKRRPVKAPAAHEPALPPGPCLVVGVVGLDCLGRPMLEATVHRPERFQHVTGCTPGEPIRWDHLAALARHPEGLFKGAQGPRAMLLNKADLAPALPSPAQLSELAVDLAVVCSLGTPDGAIVTVREGRP